MSAKDVGSALGSTQDRDRFALSTPFAAACTDSEKILCGLWEQVLIIDGLGIDDDFFLLGGDSLAAVTLFSEVERVFGTKPPLVTLVEQPTVRKFGAYLDAATTARAGATSQGQPPTVVPRPLVAIQPAGARLPLYLVHGNGGNVLIMAGLVAHLPPDQPLYGVTARGLVEGEAMHTGFDALVEDYLAAIRRVQPAGPYNLGGYCIGGMIACEMARRLHAAGEDVGTVIMIDPDYNRVLTPWLYWRFPDAPATRLVRMVAGIGWHARISVLRVLRRAPGAKIKDARDRRRVYAMQDQLAKAFEQYGRQPYNGRVVLLGSADRVKRASRFKAGWRVIAPAICPVVIAPTHYALFRSHISILGAAINAILESRPVEDAIRAASPGS